MNPLDQILALFEDGKFYSEQDELNDAGSDSSMADFLNASYANDEQKAYLMKLWGLGQKPFVKQAPIERPQYKFGQNPFRSNLARTPDTLLINRGSLNDYFGEISHAIDDHLGTPAEKGAKYAQWMSDSLKYGDLPSYGHLIDGEYYRPIADDEPRDNAYKIGGSYFVKDSDINNFPNEMRAHRVIQEYLKEDYPE